VIRPPARGAAALLIALLFSCTQDAAVPPEPEGSSPHPSLILPVVASLTGPTAATDATYVEGMQLAEAVVNGDGGIAGRELRLEIADDGGDEATASTLLAEAVAGRPAAVLIVDGANALRQHRLAIEGARVPVILLAADLYTGRGLFRYVFQTAIPVRWQARVLARYLVADREYASVVLVTESGPGEEAARASFEAAMAEEGSGLAAAVSVLPGGPGNAFPELPPVDPGEVLRAASGSDAVVFIGSAETAAGLSRSLERLDPAPQLALSSEGLQPTFATRNQPRPGTVVLFPYAWSGWADMILRVHAFRVRFAGAFEHVPSGLEQEGYDAVMAMAEGLERTRGQGGDTLVRALESFRDQTYSSIPIRLGPDDHVLAEESHLGLFAVSRVPPPPPEVSSLIPWRPIMRTFTTDGEKVNILDRDKRVFFPFWHKKRPSPKYWRSRYGIVTRLSDPLH
jgi:ABC-type branched-subunit amino acid transport system substrate-binding protein